ncbi:THAP domain-containing protein 4 isoform 1 [Camelus ferus]|nr:THAP domain-containing protein 4 isoform 1 [Camelus ferus]
MGFPSHTNPEHWEVDSVFSTGTRVEHFTKDSFSKRLEDQHRLLKPTAVPSIFHLAEKKRGAGGHGRTRRRDTRKASGGVRAHSSDGDGKAAAGSTSSSSESPMAKPESRKAKRAALQGKATPRAAPGAASPEQAPQAPEGSPDGGPAPAMFGSQGAASALTGDAGDENATSPAGGLVDKSGISMDDFTPLGSGACKFIGSLHSYSFSSKHTRERPSVPREPVDRKRLKRDVEPGCSGTGPGPDKGSVQSPPTSSLTATPQKPSQSPSAPPADVTPQPAAEAVQSEQSDASPMSINEVILSASGACKLIDSLHSYCFSSRQSKSQVCCLREQVEKKNGELKALRQRVSRSDSQVRQLQEKLAELRRVSFPYLSSLLTPGHGQLCGLRNRQHLGEQFCAQRLSELRLRRLPMAFVHFPTLAKSTYKRVCFESDEGRELGPQPSLPPSVQLPLPLISVPEAPWGHLLPQASPCPPGPLALFSVEEELQGPKPEPARMNPVVEPLSWMLGTWLSDPPGAGTFPTLQPFQYLEEAHISHVGQPMLNFSFSAFHPDTHKPMHRECGFIRLQPDTNKVAFVSAQNTGIVEVEEGEVNGQELCIASHSIARISFAREPHVEQTPPSLRMPCVPCSRSLRQSRSRPVPPFDRTVREAPASKNLCPSVLAAP